MKEIAENERNSYVVIEYRHVLIFKSAKKQGMMEELYRVFSTMQDKLAIAIVGVT
jgi:hypothetical protein